MGLNEAIEVPGARNNFAGQAFFFGKKKINCGRIDIT